MKEWIQKFKIAIIEEDMDKISTLSSNIPTTKDTDLAVIASALIKEAINLCKNEKINLSAEMAKLKKAKQYLR